MITEPNYSSVILRIHQTYCVATFVYDDNMKHPSEVLYNCECLSVAADGR